MSHLQQPNLKLSPQHVVILKHLQTYPHLTTLEAMFVKGIGRVATRVFELKSKGIPIVTSIGKDLAGRRYAQYALTEEGHKIVGKLGI